jgi:hydroxyacylglutathione hydrolase
VALGGGMTAWRTVNGPVEATELITADRIDGRAVPDVRQVAECASGRVPRSVYGELGDLPGRAQAAPGEAVLMCGHGDRAMTAASSRPARSRW